MNKQEYKLHLNLSYSAQALSREPTICILCKDFMTGTAYRLIVKESGQELYFDEDCFDQLLAVGIGFLQQRNQEDKN